MADKSKIEWCDATWNPIVGCSIQSKGCTNCYAMKMAARIEKMQRSKYDDWRLDVSNIGTPEGSSIAPFDSPYKGLTQNVNGNVVWTGKVNLATDQAFYKPLSWKNPRKIFVNSMGDLFHENVPFEWVDKVFTIMAITPRHTYQILTKNPKRMNEYIATRLPKDEACSLEEYFADIPYHSPWLIDDVVKSGGFFSEEETDEFPYQVVNKAYCQFEKIAWPLKNVWLGVSVENQETANERIPLLLDTPAAVRFISAEPLLEPIDLEKLHYNKENENFYLDAIEGCNYDTIQAQTNKLDWVIVGGESGSNARPMKPDWVRKIRNDCLQANIPFFFKQWGEWSQTHELNCSKPEFKGLLWHNFDPDTSVCKIGKKRAGNSLDGVQYLEFPSFGGEYVK